MVDFKVSCLGKCLKLAKKNMLIICLLVALALGIGLGAALRSVQPPFTTRQIFYLRFPGDLLMNMLQFLIVPLIISSLISGLSSLETSATGRMGARAVVYYLSTTFAAVVVGIVLAISIQPGKRGEETDETIKADERVVNTADTFLDLIRQSFPSNIVEMCFMKEVTMQELQKPSTTDETTTVPLGSVSTVRDSGLNPNASTVDKVYNPVVTKVDGLNVLGMVVFSIFLGVIMGRMGEKGRILVQFFDAVCEATMMLVRLVIWYSPIGIMCLIAAKIVEMEDPGKTFEQLLFYFLTVMVGLIFHGFISLPLIYFVVVRKNPFRYLYGVIEAIVTALATSSSSATLPVTMRCLEENNGIDSRVTKFVAPVGATINMDGTALYEAVAVLFIGQMRGFEMDIGRIITISITATTAAIGAAGVPQAGLVTMVIVLSAVGFPTDDVALILAVDWLLDRFRTAINVLGDAYGAGIVAHLSGFTTEHSQKADIDDKSDIENPSGDSETIPILNQSQNSKLNSSQNTKPKYDQPSDTIKGYGGIKNSNFIDESSDV